MLKKIIKDTVKTMIDRPKLIRMALLTSYSYTLYQIYGVIYFFNGIVNMKYDSGVDVSDALIYLVNSIQKFNMLRFIVTIVLLFLLGLSIFGPIGRQALLYSIDDKKMGFRKSFIKGWKKWGAMAEFGGVNMRGLSWWSVFIFSVRFRMLGYLNNIVVEAVFVIWILCVLGKTVFWPYVNYFIVLRNYSAWDAVIKSMSLTFSNFGLTIKGLIKQLFVRARFILNSCVLIGVPILLIIGAVYLNIINNSFVEIVAWVMVGIALLIYIYLEAIYRAFDDVYWYNIFCEAEKHQD